MRQAGGPSDLSDISETSDDILIARCKQAARKPPHYPNHCEFRVALHFVVKISSICIDVQLFGLVVVRKLLRRSVRWTSNSLDSSSSLRNSLYRRQT